VGSGVVCISENRSTRRFITPGKASAAREVLLLLTQLPHMLITAAPLLTELARILQHPRVRALHGLDDAGIQAFPSGRSDGVPDRDSGVPPPVQLPPGPPGGRCHGQPRGQ
jgi:hypothetical protein